MRRCGENNGGGPALAPGRSYCLWDSAQGQVRRRALGSRRCRRAIVVPAVSAGVDCGRRAARPANAAPGA